MESTHYVRLYATTIRLGSKSKRKASKITLRVLLQDFQMKDQTCVHLRFLLSVCDLIVIFEWITTAAFLQQVHVGKRGKCESILSGKKAQYCILNTCQKKTPYFSMVSYQKLVLCCSKQKWLNCNFYQWATIRITGSRIKIYTYFLY